MPSPSPKHKDLIEKLLARGYVPLPTKGKIWVDKFGGQSLRDLDSAPDPNITRAAFQENPHAGISVTAPYLRGTDLKLVGIDVDLDDPEHVDEILLRIARIIGQPCPIKRGKRGGTFFCTYSGTIALSPSYSQRHGNNVRPTWLRGGRIVAPYPVEYGQKEQGIDLIGQAPYYHSVLPPSPHPDTGQPYQWIPFPGTDTVLQLEDIDPGDLPHLSAVHLMLLAICMQPGLDPVWNFIGATEAGQFNHLMVAGTHALYHEQFTIDEIIYLALREARRDPPSPSTLHEREAAIPPTVRNLERKKVEKNSSQRAKSKRTADDRTQAEWLLETLGRDNCGVFNGDPYRWDGQHWESMLSPGHPEYMAEWFQKIAFAFPAAGLASIRASIGMAKGMMATREASTDPELMPFSNGVLHVPTMVLRPETREDYFVGYLPYQFNPDAVCPAWDMFIRDLTLPPEGSNFDPGDHQLATDLVEEYLGYCLVRSYDFRNILLLIGATSTGKSVLTKVVRGLVPRTWITEVALDSFTKPNSLRRMANSLVNISAETGRFEHGQAGVIDTMVLRITSGELVEVKTLYQDSVEVSLPTRLIVNGNMPPDFNDSTGALEKRILLIRTTDVIPAKPMPAFERRLLKEAQGILTKLALAYRRLLARETGFLRPVYSIQEAAEATQDANSVAAWVNMVCKPIPRDQPKLRVSNAELYAHYQEWCEMAGFRPYNLIRWGTILSGMGYPSFRTRVGGSGYAKTRCLSVLNHVRAGVDY